MSIKYEIQKKVLEFIKEHNNDLFSIFKKDEKGEIIHEINEEKNLVKVDLDEGLSELLKDYDEYIINDAITEIIMNVLKEAEKLEKEVKV